MVRSQDLPVVPSDQDSQYRVVAQYAPEEVVHCPMTMLFRVVVIVSALAVVARVKAVAAASINFFTSGV